MTTVPVVEQLRTRIRDVTAKRDRAAADHYMGTYNQCSGELDGLRYALGLLTEDE